MTGANGYIGTRLLNALGEQGHQIIAVVRNKSRLRNDVIESLGDQLSIIEADLANDNLSELTRQIDAAYYLLHSMSGGGDFMDAEARCAQNFIDWVEPTDCQQIVYMGALLPDEVRGKLSNHLSSRERVYEILQSSSIPLTTLRASVIVGSGSASFEMIRDLVEKLPVMLTPKWVRTKCQPIAVRNVIHYLSEVIDYEECKGGDYDIGGPEQISYGDMLRRYAKIRGLKRLIIPVPLFSPSLSSHWLKLLTATNIHLARALVKSLSMKTVCRNDSIKKIIPQDVLNYDQAIERALSKIAQNIVPSTWYGSLVSGTLTHDQLKNINVPEYGVFHDRKTAELEVSRDECIESVWQLGGNAGWPSMNWAWKVRGVMDKLVGGIGMRRGRRHPTKLNHGDAVDFWRVIMADKNRGRLILYAEMKLPGEAWLEYRVLDGNISQIATFRPKGLFGRLYWFSTYPFHLIIFPQMIKRLANGWMLEKKKSH